MTSKRLKRALIFFCLFVARASSACLIQRGVDVRDPMQSFARYTESEKACGVQDDALPYILKAKADVAFRGTVVLIHGLEANPRHMRQLADHLQEQGFNVVAPILEGHGGKDSFLATATLTKWQKDVEYAGNIARQLGEPIFLGGHSTGGVLAALEAANHPEKYSAIFALDPAMNLSGTLAKKAGYACLGSYIATYETDPIISGAPHKSFQEQIQEIKDKVQALVDEHCGAGFPIPSYNTHYTLAGICALTQAVSAIKKISPQSLPPTMVLTSQDSDFYGPRVSKEQIKAFVRQIPQHQLIETKAQSHPLMPAACSPDYESTVASIEDWLRSFGRSQMVQGSSTTSTQ